MMFIYVLIESFNNKLINNKIDDLCFLKMLCFYAITLSTNYVSCISFFLNKIKRGKILILYSFMKYKISHIINNSNISFLHRNHTLQKCRTNNTTISINKQSKIDIFIRNSLLNVHCISNTYRFPQQNYFKSIIPKSNKVISI